MISPKTQTNLANAKTYFKDHLTSHFERKSVVRDVELWTDAARELRGTEATVTGSRNISLPVLTFTTRTGAG